MRSQAQLVEQSSLSLGTHQSVLLVLPAADTSKPQSRSYVVPGAIKRQHRGRGRATTSHQVTFKKKIYFYEACADATGFGPL